MWLLYVTIFVMVLLLADHFFIQSKDRHRVMLGIAFIIAVTLFSLIFIGVTGAQQHPANAYNIEKDNYWEWKTWTAEQKKFYVWGVLTGAYAMASDLSFNSGYVDLLQIARDILPDDYQVRDYTVAIEWIYEQPEMRDPPAWGIIFRVDELLEIRRDYEQLQ